jgi:hypothetical protein
LPLITIVKIDKQHPPSHNFLVKEMAAMPLAYLAISETASRFSRDAKKRLEWS